MGKILNIILLLTAFPSSYFIYKRGSEALEQAHIPSGDPAYMVLFLTISLPLVLGFMMLFALLKSPLTRFFPFLLLLNIGLLFWLKSQL